jgi:4'-phosphopantetheinyl transferase
MPLLLDQLTGNGCRLLVWHVTETEEDLEKFSNGYNFAHSEPISSIKIANRRKQKLVTGLLADIIAQKHCKILYSDAGKPFLADFPGYISVSHGGNYVGMIYHESLPPGLDIEVPADRIRKIASKFVNDQENARLNDQADLHDLYLIWGVKEALFKSYGGGGIVFKSHLLVHQPEGNKQKGHGEAEYLKNEMPEKHHYHFFYLEDALLVYTIAL